MKESKIVMLMVLMMMLAMVAMILMTIDACVDSGALPDVDNCRFR